MSIAFPFTFAHPDGASVLYLNEKFITSLLPFYSVASVVNIADLEKRTGFVDRLVLISLLYKKKKGN